MRPLAITIASAFGTGFVSPGSGTWGTFIGAFLIWGISLLHLHSVQYILIGALVFISIIGYWAILQLKNEWNHDDSRITVDEVVGIFITMIFIPLTVRNIVIGVVVFRIFDIWKPLGIRKIDDLHTDWGVIADDGLAGVYANICTRILIAFIPWT